MILNWQSKLAEFNTEIAIEITKQHVWFWLGLVSTYTATEKLTYPC